MRHKGLFSFLIFLAILIHFNSAIGNTMKDTCIRCHTDENILKNLVVLPVSGGGEGEG